MGKFEGTEGLVRIFEKDVTKGPRGTCGLGAGVAEKGATLEPKDDVPWILSLESTATDDPNSDEPLDL
jgi:hypothetical protein